VCVIDAQDPGLRAGADLGRSGPERGLAPPQRQEFPVERETLAMTGLLAQRPVHVRARERVGGGGIGQLGVAQLGELAAPAAPHGLAQRGVAVVHEVEEGRRLAVLLAHEEERQVRGAQGERGGQPELLGTVQGREPLASRPVSDLVVVLGTDHEAIARDVARRRTVAPIAEARALAVVDEGGFEGLGERLQAAEVLVVAAALARELGVERVVEVVAPDRGEAEPALSPARTSRGSLASLSAIRWTRRPDAQDSQASASSSRKGRALVSRIACTASRRRPSR
jgi:hypothetical protein